MRSQCTICKKEIIISSSASPKVCNKCKEQTSNKAKLVLILKYLRPLIDINAIEDARSDEVTSILHSLNEAYERTYILLEGYDDV